jgi:hypothetical protein
MHLMVFLMAILMPILGLKLISDRAQIDHTIPNSATNRIAYFQENTPQ